MPKNYRPIGPRGFLTDEEKAQKPEITRALLQRISSYLKPYWLRFLLVFIAILLSAAIGLLPSIITGRIVDEALIGKDMALLIRLLLLAFLTLTVSQAINVVESYINAWISQRIIFDMKNEMYAHLQRMPHAFFTTERQGDIVTRMNSDIDGVSSVISGTLTSIISNITIVMTTLIALFSMSWQLAIVGICVIPLLILPTRKVGITRWGLLTRSQMKNDEMNQLINEDLSASGSLLIKLFTREKLAYDHFVEVNKDMMQLSLEEKRSWQWFVMLMTMFSQLGPLLIYFAGGAFIILRTDPALTAGIITSTVALVNRLYRPVQSLLGIQADFTRSLALFTRIFDYLDMDVAIRERENPLKPDLSNPTISFEHVYFSYSPEVPILRDLTFSVPGGEIYAIVGASGSGKSTAVNLIPRLYDVKQGCVRINGVDVRDFLLEYLRDSIGVVTQETYLFNGTIAENLRFAKEDASDAELIEACKVASIHNFITAQPKGYDTVVGNRGLKLSGGEKQRLSIARVVLKDPRILILDEATSSLDSISENAIQKALEILMKGRTSIVIAHRLSTILAANKILVLKDGHVAESGGHEELLKADGVYKMLYDTQFAKILELENGNHQATAIPEADEVI